MDHHRRTSCRFFQDGGNGGARLFPVSDLVMSLTGQSKTLFADRVLTRYMTYEFAASLLLRPVYGNKQPR